MRTRMILAAAAVVATALSAPAEARHHHAARPLDRPFVDVAAIPPYPLAGSPCAGRQPRQGRGADVHQRREAREAAPAVPEPSKGETGSGVIRSAKTGATATVSPAYRDRFQALLDDLEANGATVYYMGGWRRGRCSLGSQHPCGWAVDFCQDYRGHVSGARDCNLPRPVEFHMLARAHGLYDGSVWCDGDYGHVQAKDSGGCNRVAHGSWGHGRVRLAEVSGTVSARRHRFRHRRYYAAR